MHGRWSRRRNRAAHAPEFDISGGFDAKNLTRVWQKTNCKNQPDYAPQKTLRDSAAVLT
jgi:hypothetical protein